MMPVSFAKLLLRLGATVFISLSAVSQFFLVIVTMTQQPSPYAPRAASPEMVLVLSAYTLQMIFVMLIWLFAGLLARFFVPRGSDLIPDPLYRQYEQAGFWLIGGYCLLKALRGFDADLLGNTAIIDNPSMALPNLCLAIVLILGLPGLIADAIRRRFHRAPH